jgi:hypothetical protein
MQYLKVHFMSQRLDWRTPRAVMKGNSDLYGIRAPQMPTSMGLVSLGNRRHSAIRFMAGRFRNG